MKVLYTEWMFSRTSLFSLALAVLTLLPFWHYRHLYFTPSHPEYLQDYFDHSQWSMPTSPRTMGDSPLYQIAGWKIVHGYDLSRINPEVPPLGKYAFGLSMKFLGSAHWPNILFLLLSIGGFFVLAKKFFSTGKAQILTVLFASQPALWSQLGATLLDLPQLAFFLWHVLGILHVGEAKTPLGRRAAVLLAGVSLGAFAGVKFGISAIILIIAATFFLWKQKRLFWIIPLGAITFLSYLAVYLPYFATYNLLDWLRMQKWMFDFYSSSGTRTVPGMVIWSVMTAQYRGWWGGGWETIREWTPLWSFGLLSFAFTLKDWKKLLASDQQSYLALTLLGFLGFYAITPFWPRYVLLILPLFILAFGKVVLPRIQDSIFGKVSLVAIALLPLFGYLFQGPQGAISYLEEKWRTSSYPEFYMLMQSPTSLDWQAWSETQKVRADLLGPATTDLDISLDSAHSWSSQLSGTARVTYNTPIGPIEFSQPIKLTHSGSEWRILWPDTLPNDVVFIPETAPGGRFINQEEIVLSQPGNQQYLSLQPSELEDPEAMLLQTTHATGHESIEQLRLDLFHHSASDFQYPVGWILPTNDPKSIELLDQQPGVTVETKLGRIYHDALMGTLVLHEVLQAENREPKHLPTMGGRVMQGNTVLLEKASVPGQDIVVGIPLPVHQKIPQE